MGTLLEEPGLDVESLIDHADKATIRIPDGHEDGAEVIDSPVLATAADVGDKALAGAQIAERRQDDSPVVGGIALRGAWPGQRFGSFVEKLPRSIRGGIDIYNPKHA